MALDFPNSPTVGQVFTGGMGSWKWDGSKWVPNSAGTGTVTISDTPPASPTVGSFWFDSVGVQLYVYYNDGNSSQWVPANNQALAGFLALSGGVMTGPMTIAGGSTANRDFAVQGVQDGTSAAAGIVGEYLSITGTQVTFSGPGTIANLCSLTLTAGDWSLDGAGSFTGDQPVYVTSLGINTVSATMDNFATIMTIPNIAGSFGSCVPTIRYRFSLTASTVVYLVGRVGYWAGTAGTVLHGTGFLQAWRTR